MTCIEKQAQALLTNTKNRNHRKIKEHENKYKDSSHIAIHFSTR